MKNFAINVDDYQDRKCPICKSTNESAKIETAWKNHMVDLRVPLFVAHCKNCDLRYQSPAIGNNDLNYIYSNFYVGNKKEQVSRFINEKRRRKKSVMSFSSFIEKGKLDIAEVGSSSGYNLLNLQETFPKNNYFGYDLDKESVEYGKSLGINLSNQDFFSTKKKFDFIFLNHVYEHIMDPIDFLKSLSNKLNKSGLIAINVPDSSVWNEIPSWEHLNYFSGESIKKIGEKLNWKIITINTEIIEPGGHDFPELRVVFNPSQKYVDIKHVISEESVLTWNDARIREEKRSYIRDVYDSINTTKEERRALAKEFKKIKKGRTIGRWLLWSRLYVMGRRKK